MPYGRVDYPQQMVDAARVIANSAIGINGVMGGLKTDQIALLEQSNGAAAGAFAEVQQAWERSGLNNAAKFEALGKAVEDAKLSMDEFDQLARNAFLR